MATQASPGLNAPSAYDATPGLPPEMSFLAAQSAGLLKNNLQLTMGLIGASPRTLLECESNGGANGTNTNPGLGGFDTMNVAAGGGPGGMNMDSSHGTGQKSQVATVTQSAALATANQYGG